MNNGMSTCYCGHIGDVPLEGSPNYENAVKNGQPNQHGGLIGHGACEVAGCPCEQFRWKEYIQGKH